MIEFLPERVIVVDIFGWQIRWYGVLYVVAFWLAWWWLPKLQTYRDLKLTEDSWMRLIVWAIVGVLVGGRLGYAVFYEPGFFLSNPGQLFAIWNGGMSSHGGFIGAGIALWYAAKRMDADIWRVLDVVVVPVAVGLALGRLGNWINQELYPGNLALLAVVKNLLIAGVCYAGLQGKFSALRKPGRVTAVFLILYGVLRFLTEYVRIIEWPTTLGLTRGQLLTVPVLLIGLWLWQRKSVSRPGFLRSTIN